MVAIVIPTGVGCSRPDDMVPLADPRPVVPAREDSGLIDFLHQLIDRIEALVVDSPELWVRFAELFGGPYAGGS